MGAPVFINKKTMLTNDQSDGTRWGFTKDEISERLKKQH
jgi:hypothetical protein